MITISMGLESDEVCGELGSPLPGGWSSETEWADHEAAHALGSGVRIEDPAPVVSLTMSAGCYNKVMFVLAAIAVLQLLILIVILLRGGSAA